MTVFTCYKKKDTDEYHIFEGKMNADRESCSVPAKSICRKMDNSEKDGRLFACVNEVKARLKSAEHGRPVCGTCVSHLYTSY